MKASITVPRAAGAVVAVAGVAALLQGSEVNPAATLAAAAALTTSATVAWLMPSAPHALLLGPMGLLLIAAVGVEEPLDATAYAMSRAAGALAVSLAVASVADSRASRAVALVGGAIAGGIHLLVYDPFFDPGCGGCGHAGVAVWADADLSPIVWWLGFGVIGVAVAIELCKGRAMALAVASPAFAFAAAPTSRWAVAITAGAATAVWVRRCWTRWHQMITIHRLLDLEDAAGLDGAALGESGRWARRGSTVDALQLDPETTLRLHNRLLDRELEARVADLASRRRDVVTRGTTYRRSLERDLHDGVQQELLALGLDLRLAIDTRHPADDPDVAVLGRALSLVHECVDAVRVISSDASPPMLETHGLRSAVTALARRRGASRPVELELIGLDDRLVADDVARAAFGVVVEAFARGATSVRAACVGCELTVRGAWEQRANTSEYAEGTLPDLVAAVGGRIRYDASSIEAAFPCG